MENGIIKPVQVPTDWTSAMVVVRKQNDKIRLCIDPKPLNRALKGNHHPLPTIDDLLPKLVQAKVFGVLDAKNEERREQSPYNVLYSGGPLLMDLDALRSFAVSRRIPAAVDNGVAPSCDDCLGSCRP